MRVIHPAARRGNSPTPEQIAIQQAARAVLDADKRVLDKADRVFLQVLARHGMANPEGRERLNNLSWLLNGGRHG